MDSKGIYQNYLDDCQSPDAGDISKNKPAKLLPIPTSLPYWTSSGTAGKFLWRSLTSVFSPEIHTLDSIKKRYNDFHDLCRRKGGSGLMRLIIDSIDYDPEISQILRNFRVINTNVMYTGRPESAVINGMVQCFQDVMFDYADVLVLKNSYNLSVDPDTIQGKDLVYPDLLITPQSLKQYASIASTLCKAGAKTCVGVFLTRLMPNEEGQYPDCLPQEMGLPIINGFSSEELADIASAW